MNKRQRKKQIRKSLSRAADLYMGIKPKKFGVWIDSRTLEPLGYRFIVDNLLPEEMVEIE